MDEETKALKLERARIVKRLKSRYRKYVQKRDPTNSETTPVYNDIIGELKSFLYDLGEW